MSLTRQGGNPVNGSVYLADPSNPGGLTGDDSDYHLYFDTGSPAIFAAGTTTFTLTASASTGTVSQTLEFVVDGGTTKFVVIEPNQSTNWIYRVPVVAPPPYESIDICQPGQPRTDWTGSYVVEDQFGVFQGDHWPAHCGLDGSGGCDPGVSNLTTDDQFRLTLVDSGFHQVSDGVFEVTFPPSGSYPLTYGGPWQASTNGTLTITLPGKGYFWVRYPSMPHNPGVYTLLIEPLDTGYNTSTLKGYLSYAGTVVGAEILDENFQPAPSLQVDQPTTVYVRYVGIADSGDTVALELTTEDDLGTFDDSTGITATRVGNGDVFVSEPIEVDPPWSGDSTQGIHTQSTQHRVRLSKKGHLKVIKAGRFIAQSVARSGGPYSILMGLEFEIEMYKAHSWSNPNGYRYFLCSPQAADCGPTSDWVDPSKTTWTMSPAGVDQNGDGQIGRMEYEFGPIPAPGSYFRAIRYSTSQVPDGKITITGQNTVDVAANDSVQIQVHRPGHLGGVGHLVTYGGSTILLDSVVLDMANQYGIPPQFLMAQVFGESSGNPYAFRYEPTSRDWTLLAGDTPQPTGSPVDGAVRNLTDPNKANQNLALLGPSSGQLDFLPCLESWWDPSPVPCISTQTPPSIESVTLQQLDSTQFQIPTLGSDKAQLGMTITNASGTVFTQIFPGSVGSGDPSEYTVNGDTGIITFAQSQTGPLTAAWRRVKVLSDAQTSSSISDPLAAISEIISNKSPGNNVPPASPYTTIRTWALARTSTPVTGKNQTLRYGQAFSGPTALWELIQQDPSFEVQGQWFAAASYGLLQIIPDTVRAALYSSGYSAADQATIKAVYDPLKDNPVEKLFDPTICTFLASLMDARADAKPEFQLLSNETPCLGDSTSTPSECSWNRWFKRRLRVFNTGTPTGPDGGYADSIVDVLSPSYAPQP